MAEVKLQGTPCQTNGDLPAIGSNAPEFVLTDKALKDIGLANFIGKKKVLNIVPSLDTPTCAKSTKQFNDIAQQNSEVAFLIISADLPFAMSRFCGAEGLKNVVTLSMMRSRNFAKDYGVLLQDGPLAGITSRAVLVLNEENKVLHAELVEEIANEPNYDAVVSKL